MVGYCASIRRGLGVLRWRMGVWVCRLVLKCRFARLLMGARSCCVYGRWLGFVCGIVWYEGGGDRLWSSSGPERYRELDFAGDWKYGGLCIERVVCLCECLLRKSMELLARVRAA
jgi:hypothetical protein